MLDMPAGDDGDGELHGRADGPTIKVEGGPRATLAPESQQVVAKGGKGGKGNPAHANDPAVQHPNSQCRTE